MQTKELLLHQNSNKQQLCCYAVDNINCHVYVKELLQFHIHRIEVWRDSKKDRIRGKMFITILSDDRKQNDVITFYHNWVEEDFKWNCNNAFS